MKKKIKCNNRIKTIIPDHAYRILKVGGSGSRKTNSLFNLISQLSGIDNIYLYAKDPSEAKYQLLFNKHKNTSLKHFDDSKAFTEYEWYEYLQKYWRIQPK